MFRAIYACEKSKMSMTYTCLSMLISNLNKVSIKEDDLVIIAIDARNNWRKELDPCLDKDTEVLTEEGWMFLKDVVENKMKIKVATLNPDKNIVEYHYPNEYYKTYYKGIMYKLGGKQHRIDLLMTPEHNHYIKLKGWGNKFYLKKARDISEKSPIESNREFPYEAIEQKYFTLPFFSTRSEHLQESGAKKIFIVEYPEKQILMDDWLKLLGWYLAEGCVGFRNKTKTTYEKVSISQSSTHNPKYCDEIRQVFKDNNIPASEYMRNDGLISFCIMNTQIATYLAKFGKSHDKFIPRELLNTLSKRQLNILLLCLLKGDGTKKSHKHVDATWQYTTVSKQLANDVQELALKCGYSAVIVNNNKLYFVSITKNFTPSTKKKIICDFEDDVYDLEVPNHLFFIRRNGKPCWTGNCYKANRKEDREKHAIDWDKTFEDFNYLTDKLEAFTPFHTIVMDKMEADDIIAIAAKKFQDLDTVVISSDSDYEQLAIYPKLKIFSPLSKKFKEVKNPHKVLANKIKCEKADNLTKPILTDEDYEIRNTIVNLMSLPDYVEKPIMEKLEFFPLKDWSIEDLTRSPTMIKRIKNIYIPPKEVKHRIKNKIKENGKNVKGLFS